ncbi:hypothetical protein BV25DRAFT_363368 [Artomyces pyxidatus]|uniref:Uncharacterized protein n=1 Tax=Artomyces pyxidatus TaxID=48021 RepID=A0ACB8T6R4_9AGAM|nr:hypothetical protein BV25DRAFT_363368 [Artomyces pyxidatus]
MMASYLRSIFGGGQSSSQGKPKSKNHNRIHSAAAPNYIYGSPAGFTPSASITSSRPKLQRASSCTATPAKQPSSLRFATYDSRRSQESTRPSVHSTQPIFYRTTSHNSHEQHGRYPQFPQPGYVTPTSSRSNSNSSLYPPALHASSGPSPLSPSFYASSTASSDRDRRPNLKQNHTWPQAGVSTSASGSSTYAPSVSRSQHRTPTLHMHPLFAYARLHHAPISYDIAFTPSARTVLDRTIHKPVPALTLAQPATEPPTPASSRLVLRSHKFPWLVVVGPVGSSPSFFLGSGNKPMKSKSNACLTNLDVLYAVHTTLMLRVTPEEWESLGNGSKAQRKVAAAYQERCKRMGGGWEGGVRRLDWLGSKTRLVGIEVDKGGSAGNVGKLVFGRA